jgi:uncharacterized membrane protein YeaQ/YmgE (transglycosylase-associated protein family)
MLLHLLVILIVAAVIGSVGATLAGSRTAPGCLGSIALGFVGALLGNWLSQLFRARDLIEVAGIPIIWSVIGAALFVALLGAIPNR